MQSKCLPRQSECRERKRLSLSQVTTAINKKPYRCKHPIDEIVSDEIVSDEIVSDEMNLSKKMASTKQLLTKCPSTICPCLAIATKDQCFTRMQVCYIDRNDVNQAGIDEQNNILRNAIRKNTLSFIQSRLLEECNIKNICKLFF